MFLFFLGGQDVRLPGEVWWWQTIEFPGASRGKRVEGSHTPAACSMPALSTGSAGDMGMRTQGDTFPYILTSVFFPVAIALWVQTNHICFSVTNPRGIKPVTISSRLDRSTAGYLDGFLLQVVVVVLCAHTLVLLLEQPCAFNCLK